MAQEVQTVMPSAVLRGSDGYLRVSYDKLGLKFQTYDSGRHRALMSQPGQQLSGNASAQAGDARIRCRGGPASSMCRSEQRPLQRAIVQQT
jgi:hypothetical protein